MIELPLSNRKFVILAGNPNAGKSTLFNTLTGLSQRVGNYPGITVDRKTGSLTLAPDLQATLLDLPGAYSMYPTSKDERIVVRQFLSEVEQPDLIVYVADVSQLEKQMLLLTQLRDLGYPMLLALNMIDLPGVTVKTQILEEHLGIPVVPISSKTGLGITALKMQIASLLRTPPPAQEAFYKVPAAETKLIYQLDERLPFPTIYGKALMLHHAPWLTNLSPTDKEAIAKAVREDGFNPIQSQITETLGRYDKFTPVIRKALHLEAGGAGMRFTDRIDRWVMHPVIGVVIFFLIMLLIFQAIFAWTSVPMDFIESMMSNLAGGVRSVMPDGWIEDIICDGLIAGLTGIIIFIPQIAILFLLLGILEEIGYMARAVSMFDVLMRKFGLNGRSIVALVAGGACAIPAIMSTRNISNWKERLITIMVTPFISCSARIPVYAILIGFAVPQKRVMGLEQQGIALMGLYAMGIVAALLAAYIMKKVVRTGDRSYLMMELPVYRPPVGKNLAFLTFEKTKAFVVGAGKIILIISLVLWFLASFGPATSGGGAPTGTLIVERPPIEESFAGKLGHWIEPAIAPLGFDWKMGIAIVTSFAAREVFVGTMATIYSIEDDGDVDSIRTRMANERNPETGAMVYNPATTWSLLIFYVFAMQCMSTLAIVKRETKSWKWPIIQFVMMTGLAYVASFAVYQIMS
jgi:ferrous iron transport protein B